VKAQFVYQLPAGFLFGASYTFQTGRPWARQVRVPDLGITTTINAEERDGDRRVANWNLLDLRLEKKFSLGEEASFSVFGDLLNTFNNDGYENVLSRLGTSDSFGGSAQWVLPRRLQVGARLLF
jgi:hypothetical protein